VSGEQTFGFNEKLSPEETLQRRAKILMQAAQILKRRGEDIPGLTPKVLEGANR